MYKYVSKIIVSIIKNILPYGLINPMVQKRNKIKKDKLSIPDSKEPEIFNKEGKKLRTFFLLDEMYRDQPYSFVLGRDPQYIHWDRYNYGLKTHFYTHKFITSIIGKPEKKFAFFNESEAIVPHHYKLMLENKNLANEFDKVFTHSEKLLNILPNALFLPGGGVWYGTDLGGGILNPENYNIKNKNISIVSSYKNSCQLHAFRTEIAKKYKSSPLVDTFGTFDGGKQIKISESLTDYRYSIVIENYLSPYWFTEKVMNCFASMTIPIYIGASKIGEFFNTDGIIQIDTPELSEIEKAIASCNYKDYESRMPAILENYIKVQDFLSIEDYLYETYSNIL